MSKVRLTGSTSGYTELTAPASAANNTLVLPTGNGSNGQILGTDGAGNLSWVGGRMVLETAKASTSGTSVEFTGIPSWVKRVTVMLSGVSTNGTSNPLIQAGSASYTTTGYTASAAFASSTGNTTYTTGFGVNSSGAANTLNGIMSLVNITGNIWTSAHTLTLSGTNTAYGAGIVTLSGTLDRVRITTVNGIDTFDAGSINILYEG
jgi:hypothetical protein